MGVERIHIEEFLELAKTYPVLDVRSPAEYNHAHIPNAISFPLFTDEERKVVGTTYKQQSREQAIKIGLDFFGPKMRLMVENAEKISESSRQSANENLQSPPEPISRAGKILLVHCWRGGMRSSAIAWLLDLYGFKIYTLAGGYKVFRKHVLNTFNIPFSIKILGGYTGSNKTGLLRSLHEKGEIVIDLESIANHKGSAFGNIGLGSQPGQEMFENLLAIQLRKAVTKCNELYDEGIWLEDESQRIGLVNIPRDLWSTMRASPIYFLAIPFEERLEHIVKEYGGLDKEKLITAIGRISEKLGGLNAKMAISLLEQGEIIESFRILLEYYDRLYFRGLHNRKDINSLLHTIECKSITPENANQLILHTRKKPEKA